MTEPSAATVLPGSQTRHPLPLFGEIQVSARAARALTAELARHPGPKAGLLLGATVDSEVLSAALTCLQPGDSLTVVTGPGLGDAVRRLVGEQGQGLGSRVRVVESLSEVAPADVIVVAGVLSGDATTTRQYLGLAASHLADGGVLSAAALAGPGLADSATQELARQSRLCGVGSDLVLRNSPPLRVHRLRYTPAESKTAAELAPAYRTSSVPLTRSMNIDSNGVAAASLALGAAALLRVIRPQSKWWLVPALAAVPVAAFFRDPQRQPPDDERAVVAASDGTVLGIERLRDERFASDELLRISVFLSVLDVHINRAPVAGKVVDYFVEDGGYAPAMKPQAEHNVSAYTVLDTAHGRVVVAQRTGLLARRIVHRAPVGSLVARGERFGLIRFGSRTDVYLPAMAVEPTVSVTERVLGGSTTIARWI